MGSYGGGRCRDRYGYLEEEQFSHRACATCYDFLFRSLGKKPLEALYPMFIHLAHVIRNATQRPQIMEILEPDVHNETLAARICETLNEDECERWKACCRRGTACCKRQLRNTTKARQKGRYCQRVWDGWSCWDDTAAGDTVYQPCPNYIDHTIPSSQYPSVLRLDTKVTGCGAIIFKIISTL